MTLLNPRMSDTEYSDARILMLSSCDGSLRGRSGYSLLADYSPTARLVEVLRREPRTFLHRAVTASIRRFSVSSWYRLSSAYLEYQGWRILRSGDRKSVTIHVLWGDRDLGWLDLLHDKRHQRLVCTFHACPDTLPEVVNFPSRLRRIDDIILMSRVQRPFFQAAGVPNERIHVVLHGIDTNYFRPHQRKREDRFRVLFVGSYRRNFKLLREVCSRLNKESGIQFRIVAPDTFKDNFADLNNVEFLTGLDEQQLLRTYQTSSCLLMTVHHATANNAILEAMACGIPIISENIGGIPEYVTAGAGLLSEHGRVEPLVESILRLANSRSLQSEMADAARQRAQDLDWVKVARQTDEIYRRFPGSTGG